MKNFFTFLTLEVLKQTILYLKKAMNNRAGVFKEIIFSSFLYDIYPPSMGIHC